MMLKLAICFYCNQADILNEIKISYSENEDTRLDMMQAQMAIPDVKDKVLTKAGVLSKPPVKAADNLLFAGIYYHNPELPSFLHHSHPDYSNLNYPHFYMRIQLIKGEP